MAKNPNIVPGWKMTFDQKFSYFRMFKEICVVREWRGNAEQMDAYRRQWHREAGLGDCSAKDIDRMRGFDAIKAVHLAVTQPANLDAQMRMQNMPLIRFEKAVNDLAHENFWRPLLESSRFQAHELSDLTEEQRTQFIMTLKARVQANSEDLPAKQAEPAPIEQEIEQPF